MTDADGHCGLPGRRAGAPAQERPATQRDAPPAGTGGDPGSAGRKKLRVLVIAMNYAPETVGVGRYAAETAAALAARGHAVTVVTAPPHYPCWRTGPWRADGYRNRYATETRDGVRVIRCPLPLPRWVAGWRRLAPPLGFALAAAPVILWLGARRRPHLTLCAEPTLLALFPALAAARLAGARLALHVHDLEPEAFAAGWRRAPLPVRILQRARRRADAIITLSQAMAARLAAGGVAPDRVHICPNWADIDAIAAGGDPATAARWRSWLGLRPEQRVVLCAGAINRKHTPGLLIEAARRLRDDDGAVIVLAGEGPLAEEARRAAREVPAFRWMPPQPEPLLPTLMHFADAHVLPLDPAFDDLALPSRLGAMLASGRPVVATATADSFAGRFLGAAATLCPPEPDAVAAAVKEALAQAGDQERAAARRRLARLFDRTRNLDRIARIIEGTPPPDDVWGSVVAGATARPAAAQAKTADDGAAGRDPAAGAVSAGWRD